MNTIFASGDKRVADRPFRIFKNLRNSAQNLRNRVQVRGDRTLAVLDAPTSSSAVQKDILGTKNETVQDQLSVPETGTHLPEQQ